MYIQEAVNQIKSSIEEAIIDGGQKAKTALIRSHKLINLIHDAVKYELILNGVDSESTRPQLNEGGSELNLAGLLKQKKQDICVIPKYVRPNKETLNYGVLYEEVDKYGKEYTEQILSINVRSQLSSLAKNFDTLYERTYAEALNLHLRCPKMVLGEVYMIPVYEYDTEEAKDHNIGFTKNISSLEKYLLGFQAINNRISVNEDHFKYEKVCLLIIDFNRTEPKIYNNDEELMQDGLLTNKTVASIKDLTFGSLVPELLKIYETRFKRKI